MAVPRKRWTVPRDMTDGYQWYDWSEDTREKASDDGDWVLNKANKFRRTRQKERIWPKRKQEPGQTSTGP